MSTLSLVLALSLAGDFSSAPVDAKPIPLEELDIEEGLAEPPPPPSTPPPVEAPAAPKQRAVRRVAVKAIEFTGEEDARLATILTEALTNEVRKLQRTTVISTDEVQQMLEFEVEQQLAGCETDSCISEIVEALGADALIVGQIATIGDERVFGIKLIDQLHARTEAQVSKRLTIAGGEESLALIGPAVEELFPDVPLRPGQRRGVDPEVALRLNPPPLQPWVFWSGAAATSVALAAGIGATVVNGLASQSAADRVSRATPSNPAGGADLAGDVDTVRGSFGVLVGAFGATAVLGAATGVAALFTDFAGHQALE
jgi:hypothetical protein